MELFEQSKDGIMPHKHYSNCRHHFLKSPAGKRDWARYNKQLKERDNIAIWISDNVAENWYIKDRVYDGTRTPNLYSDTAMMLAHQIRQVFKLPLRQCEGFVNSLFKLMKLDLCCPTYSVLSKRLKSLKLTRPDHRLARPDFDKVKSIAIDATGPQCYEYDSWVEEKYGKKRF